MVTGFDQRFVRISGDAEQMQLDCVALAARFARLQERFESAMVCAYHCLALRVPFPGGVSD